MKNSKINIEEIKSLIPDYITGVLDENNKIIVKNAIEQLPELNQFYNELKGTIDFLGTVKLKEPSEQYWNNLLPRIHSRIEENAEKKTAKNPISLLWKILVPVAAVVLIFIIYQIAFTPEKQLAHFGNSVTTEKKIIQDNNSENNVQNKENNIAQDNSDNETNENADNENNTYVPKVTKKQSQEDYNNYNVTEESAQNVNNQNNPEIKENLPDEKEEIAAVEIEETAIINGSQPAGFDEETEKQLKKLDDNEQNNLLEELSNTNL